MANILQRVRECEELIECKNALRRAGLSKEQIRNELTKVWRDAKQQKDNQ
jgi:orotate phosphoribosyltransferase-like protein